MRSLSWITMEGDQGDLSDIVRASCNERRTTDPALDWRFPAASVNFPLLIEEPINGFGDPFFSMQDPMTHELDMGHMAAPMFLSDTAGCMAEMNAADDESVGSVLSHRIAGEEVQMPCNSFSRMLQISPDAKMPISSCTSSALTAVNSPTGITSTSFDHTRMICPSTSTASSLVEKGGQQIPSPRNLGIKRRKGQAKKVVCVPAPAPTTGRPGGEVVPSDLWAWRKYGQKPIKGSPHPRGYYRCSSSKGCSARKQVERSRTDPNMLVITYTSEHNHPWPTQRNALAGSTRSQHMKKEAHPKSSPPSPMPKPIIPKEEHKESDTDHASSSEVIVSERMEIGTVKVEKEEMEKSEEAIDGNGKFDDGLEEHDDHKLSLKSDSNHSDDFFMDLGELEVDPIKLMFPQGMTGEKSDGGRENKGMDPFNLFDW